MQRVVPPAIDAYWSISPEVLASRMGGDLTGLTRAEAATRLALFGQNRIDSQQTAGPARQFLRQFESPLVLILIFAAGVSLGVREFTEAAIILLIVAGSTVLSFAQEYRASKAMRALKDRLTLRVAAWRDGAPVTIDATAVVPGDIISLSAGNMVPGDGVLIEARDFLVTQASLTGESFPVEKRPGLVDAKAALSARDNSVFLGTSVRSGTARVLVTRTGQDTALGAIAERLKGRDPETEFERGVRKFGYLLTRVMTAIVLFVLTANLLMHRPVIDSLLFSVALAVGLTPELLPAIISVTLSAGARRMAQNGVIVRRMAAIENLGSVGILCTDKTGTLTKGVVELSQAVDVAGIESARVFELALINSSLETGIENPLDEAVIATAKKRGIATVMPPKIDEMPYDFSRKRLTVVVDVPDEMQHRIITKGAFDAVLGCCQHLARPDGPVALTEILRTQLAEFAADRGRDGFRVLGVATRRLDPKPLYTPADEEGMVFEGMLLFFDPLKEGIVATLGRLLDLGITTKVITGDNRHVAGHIAAAAGLGGTVMTGEVLNQTSDDALRHLAEVTQIFAEVDPQQKERIVHALQMRGHVVAYLGDGINDAPSLRTADVGISVDQAVDVARESADIVLLRSDLDVLAQGVLDGRRTFANTLKYISITTSANFGNMISMAIGTLFLPFLPLLASQILLNNFLSDFPSIAISSDNVDPERITTAPRWDIGAIGRFMVVFGLLSTVFDLFTFQILRQVFHADAPHFQTAWFVVSLLTELAVVLVLRTRRPCWRSTPGRLLITSTLLVAGLAMASPYLGPVTTLFDLVPLPATMLGTGLAIVVAYILATEAVKIWYFRAPSGHHPV